MRVLLNITKYPLATLFLLLAGVVYSSCDDESDALILDETDEIYELYDYYVDESGNEGVVAYQSTLKDEDNPEPYKYLLVISADETTLPWGPMNEYVMPLDTFRNSELKTNYFSLAMLQTMYSKKISRYPAQEWCFAKNHSHEIYAGSWRLPSRNELYNILSSTSRVVKLNTAMRNIGGAEFEAGNMYWTCTEDFNNYITIKGQESDYDQANRAVITSPGNYVYGDKNKWLKKNAYHVRAIKYIYYYD